MHFLAWTTVLPIYLTILKMRWNSNQYLFWKYKNTCFWTLSACSLPHLLFPGVSSRYRISPLCDTSRTGSILSSTSAGADNHVPCWPDIDWTRMDVSEMIGIKGEAPAISGKNRTSSWFRHNSHEKESESCPWHNNSGVIMQNIRQLAGTPSYFRYDHVVLLENEFPTT